MAKPYNVSSGNCFQFHDPYDTCPLYFSNSSTMYSVTVAVTVANALCSPITVLSNAIIIYVIFKTPSLHSPVAVLLGNLALGDLLTGLLSQPTYVAFLVWELFSGHMSCTLWYVCTFLGFISSGLAFFSLTGISLERYTALFFHLRYESVVTTNVVVAGVAAAWFLVVILSCLWFVERLRTCVVVITWTFTLTCIIITCIVHLKIFKIAFRHRRQIQAQQNSTTSEILLAVSLAYIVWIYVIFYTPYFIASIYYLATRDNCSARVFYQLAGTVAYIIAAVEPFVFCWRNRNLRAAVVQHVRRMVGISSAAVHENV